VVAHQRDRAALARATHDVLEVRAPPDHVPQRPQRLGIGRLGRGDHRVKRFRMPVRVAEHRYDHVANPNRGERLQPIGWISPIG